MKHLLLSVAMAFASVFCASAKNDIDVVYLKNGSIIRGTLQEFDAEKDIKISTADGSVFVYPASDVLRMEKDKAISEKDIAKTAVDTEKQKSIEQYQQTFNAHQEGVRGILEVGPIFGKGGLTNRFAFGQQINPYFFLGCGFATNFLIDDDEVFGPLFLDFRTYFKDARSTPFVDFKIGNSLHIADSRNSGDGDWFSSLTIGFCRSKSRKVALCYSIGLMYQDYFGYNYDEDCESSEITRKSVLSPIFTFGFEW